MKGKCCIIIIILIVISGSFFILPLEDEGENNLKHYRYKDIGIVSAKKPFNTHLWWGHSTYGLVLVDSGDQTKLYISTDKSDNWVNIDLTGSTTKKIQSGWLDVNDLWLVTCDNPDNEFTVIYVELDNSNNVVDVGDSTVGDAGTVYAYDIWKRASDFFVVMITTLAGNNGILMWEVTSAPFAAGGHFAPGGGLTYDDCSFGVVAPSFTYFYVQDSDGDIQLIQTLNLALFLTGTIDNTTLPDDINQKGVAYDDDDSIYFILKLTADGKKYLYIHAITPDTITKLSEYNVALMLDRNTASGVLEKAFGITNEITYELKPKRGGLIQLQDCSAISDANLIAITDNFLMNDDGDMFEFQDVTNEISSVLYNDGIIGIQKKGTFITHPDFHINWSKGDSIKIYDQYDQLEFWGLITDKNRNNRRLYVFKIDSFTNEIYRNSYSTTYSANDTDTKQKDIIDNACDFCYRSSSIVGTTTTYNYVYNRALIYLFWLGRRLERQVPYIEPDGKIWTKAHDGLVREDMIYPGINFKDDEVGSEPTGWIINNDASCTTTIIDSLDGHRKVLQLDDQNAAGQCIIYKALGIVIADSVHEYYITKDSIAANTVVFIILKEGGTNIVLLRLIENDLQYNDGAWKNLKLNCLTTNTFIHIKIICDDTANTFDCYINGILEGADLGYNNNSTAGINRLSMETAGGSTGFKVYFDAYGTPIFDPAYTVGDNEVAWDLNNHWQDVRLVDIPGLEEGIQGFFDGNTGITRNTIRYRDNATSIKPDEATRDPIEQLKGILPLNEFRDPKIEASTEADQLGDNRYAIWSADTIFLGLRVAGQGYLQPGKTIHLENTGQITIAESNLLLLSFTRNPKNDVYTQMILSDNIIFPSEFNNLANTSRTQIHTATVQSFENQADIIAHLTPEGGLALRLTNKTGVASVKGTIIEAHAATDNAFRVCDANSVESFGIVYEDGIADGSECLVVIGGRCQVLLKDATASTRNNWVEVSDVAGRADATGASPAAAPQHFQEIGHCIESKGADTDVLAFIMLHFL